MMGFSSKQVRALRRNVEERHIRTRESANGRELSYIEGWYVISEANRIFGFDGWSRETIESKCVLARENRGAFVAVYTAKVRVTVSAEGSTIIREGHGTGEGRGDSPGEVHDTALKAAETDATKRALATFGRPFGLELYRRSRRENPSKLNGRPQVQRASEETPQMTPNIPVPQTAARAASTTRVSGETGDYALPALLQPTEAPQLAPVAKYAPDDTTPIPRPSTYHGRERYHEVRKVIADLVQSVATGAKPASDRSDDASTVSTGGLGTSIEERPTSREVSPAKIDKSALPFGEPKRLRDKAHLKFVASHPCLVCGRQPSDAHHLRFSQPRAIGMKVSDEFTVPLCRGHHRQLHQRGNEMSLWEAWKIQPLEVARRLWAESHLRAGSG